MKTDPGVAAIRLHADEASYDDVRVFLETFVESRGFRESCTTMGHLAAERSIEDRQSNCRDMVGLLLADICPPEGIPVVDPPIRTTPAMASHCAPPQSDGKWADHCKSKWERSAVGRKKVWRAQFVTVDDYLYHLISALEAFWLCQGHLLVREQDIETRVSEYVNKHIKAL